MPRQVVSFCFSLALLLTVSSLSSTPAVAQEAKKAGVDLTVRAVPAGRLAPFRKSFAKYVNVFGVHVFATARTPDSKVLHAGTILAEYLDNDENCGLRKPAQLNFGLI